MVRPEIFFLQALLLGCHADWVVGMPKGQGRALLSRLLEWAGQPDLAIRHTWSEGDLAITGRLFEDRGHSLITAIEGMTIADEPITLSGQLRFENGPIDVFKRGFKLCATQIGSIIGVSGRLDSDRFVPTARNPGTNGVY